MAFLQASYSTCAAGYSAPTAIPVQMAAGEEGDSAKWSGPIKCHLSFERGMAQDGD